MSKIEISRNRAITVLEELCERIEHSDDYIATSTEMRDAVALGIISLKLDEMYQLEYEMAQPRSCKDCRGLGLNNGVCDICHDKSCWKLKEGK